MAIIGVNQPGAETQKESGLDKVLKGIQIAQGLMGTALAVPKFIQDREEFKARKDLWQAQAENIPSPEERKAVTALKTADIKAGVGQKYRPIKPGEEPDVDLGPDFGGPLKLRESEENIFGNEANKIAYQEALKTYDISRPGDKGAEKWTFGNADVYLKPKGVDPKEKYQGVDDLRKEYLSQPVVKTFAEQAQQFEKLKAAASQKSATGDIALIFAYMKMLDPGSTVREGEFATAETAGGVPQSIANMYNKMISGERLAINRDEFVKTGTSLFTQAANQYDGVKKFYKKMAIKRGFDDDDVIVPLSQIKQFLSGPDDKKASEF